MQYLGTLYSDLTAVIENHEAFTRLLRSARGGDRDDGATGVNPLVGAVSYLQESACLQ